MLTIFSLAYLHLYILSGAVSIQIFCLFEKNEWLVFLLLNFENSLKILISYKSLLVMWLINIFSQCVGYLFILLSVFFFR